MIVHHPISPGKCRYDGCVIPIPHSAISHIRQFSRQLEVCRSSLKGPGRIRWASRRLTLMFHCRTKKAFGSSTVATFRYQNSNGDSTLTLRSYDLLEFRVRLCLRILAPLLPGCDSQTFAIANAIQVNLNSWRFS
jgi:hypothetical protein